MGTSNSTNSFNLQQYQYINQILDPRFGNIKLYQKNETNETICVIEKNFTQINHPIHKLDHPNILKVYYFKADICKKMCSTFTKVQLIQEYVTNELRVNIKNRANKQQYYEEKQLWGLLNMCLKGLMYLKQYNIYPMDLKNILLSNSGTIKFHSYYDIQNSQYMQLLNQITEEIHVSPEELENLKTKEQILNIDFEKCEIFQLGLTTLWAATLADTNSLFSYETLNYSENEMKQRIEELNYSQQLKNILLNMLKRFPNERKTFNELLQIVSYHECNENLLEIKKFELNEQSQQHISKIKQQYSQRSSISEFKIQQDDQSQLILSRISNQSNLKQQQNDISKISLDQKFNINITDSNQSSKVEQINQTRQQINHSQNRIQQQEQKNINLQIGSPNYSPLQKNNNIPKQSQTTKNSFNRTPKETNILQNPLKQNQSQNIIKNQINQKTKVDKFQHLYDTSYVSQISLMSNRTILDNKVEEAIQRSKLALEQFDQTLYKTNQFRN